MDAGVFDASVIDGAAAFDDAGPTDDASLDAGASVPDASDPRSDAGVGPALPPRRAPRAEPLFGFADLHTHPAIHLGYAGDDDGFGGLVWGGPFANTELGPVDANLAYPGRCSVDQRPESYVIRATPCDAEIHDLTEPDPVRRATRSIVLSRLVGGQAHYPHTDGIRIGRSSAFPRWPNGRDPSHQAMHIEALRRAYDGGLRVLVAAVGDTQTIARLVDVHAFPGTLDFSFDWDRETATRQLDFLHRMAAANSTWMEIVTTPEQAERVVRQERLAVVLGVELDTIRVEDLEYFYHEYGLRQVTAVHFADNEFGGCAAVPGPFNTSGAYERELFGARSPEFYRVAPAPEFGARVDRPLSVDLFPVGLGALFLPGDLAWPSYIALGYEAFPSELVTPTAGVRPIPRSIGHRNSRGINNPDAFRRLMALGMLIDLSHMGDSTIRDVIELACRDDGAGGCDACSYPLHSSHTGMRWNEDGDQSGSDRDLSETNLRRMLELGPSIVGLGTSGDVTGILDADGRPTTRLAWVRGMRRDRPTFTIAPGRVGQTVTAELPLRRATSESVPASVPTWRWCPELNHDLDASLDRAHALELRVACHSHGRNQEDTFVLTSPGEAPLVSASGAARACTDVESITSLTLVAWRERDDLASSVTGSFEPGVHGATEVSGRLTHSTCATPEWAWEVRLNGRASAQHWELPFVVPSGSSDALPVGVRRMVRIRMVSGTTDIRGRAWPLEGTHVCVDLRRNGGSLIDPYPGQQAGCEQSEVSINGGGPWERGKEVWMAVPLTDDQALPDDVTLTVRVPRQNGLPDPFDLAEVYIDEVEDPAANLARAHWRLMRAASSTGAEEGLGPGGLGIGAFGTDLNGLQYLMGYSAVTEVADGVSTEVEVGGCGASSGNVACDPASGVRRTYSIANMFVDAPHDQAPPTRLTFAERGIASVGMLPELARAMAVYACSGGRGCVHGPTDPVPQIGARPVDSLYRSAEQFIDYWYAVEDRAGYCGY
ncbi:MAG: membrane dipeptidase [Sandaracinaceae bacterium]